MVEGKDGVIIQATLSHKDTFHHPALPNSQTSNSLLANIKTDSDWNNSKKKELKDQTTERN